MFENAKWILHPENKLYEPVTFIRKIGAEKKIKKATLNITALGVYYAEIDFDLIVRAAKKQRIAVEELSRFPEVKRDLALLVDKSVSFSELRNIAFATEKKLLKRVTLFDVYEGDKLPEGKKSYALGFTLEDKNQTLNEKTIEKTMANLQRQLEAKAGAQVRS